MGRDVAFKRLKDDQDTSDSRRHFEVEARVMGRLEHPNILPVYDVFSFSDQGEAREEEALGYTMRVASYESLYERLKRQPALSHHDLCALTRQLALALAYAHQQGVIHRDVKPHNVLLGAEGEVYLVDWGVCHLMPSHPDARRLTSTRGALVGTPAFISPEQVSCDQGSLGPHTDVYGLGATLYYALTHSPPSRGETLTEALRAARDTPPIPPRELLESRGTPEADWPSLALERLCMKALAKAPQERFESARVFADALDAFLKGELERARQLEALREAVERGHQERERLQRLSAERAELEAERSRHSQALLEYKAPRDLKEHRARKEPLWRLEEALDELSLPIEEAYARATSAYREAITSVALSARATGALGVALRTTQREAREAFSEVLWERLEARERVGDHEGAAYLEERLRELGTEEAQARLDAPALLDLSALPKGTRVSVEREHLSRHRVTRAPLTEALSGLGERLSLSRGTYAITLSHPEASPCVLHLKLTRAQHLTLRCRLPRLNALPTDVVYLPDLEGGVGRAHMTHLVRYREYIEFLNELPLEEASERAPRYGDVTYAQRDEAGRFVIPFVDQEGDEWSPDWPVMMVSLYDAQAYAAWRTQRDGHAWELSSVEAWRQAAQGADARPYPWGTHFDPALCVMRDAFAGRVTPLPVGSAPSDRSPYGLYDVAGNVCQWTSSKVEGEADIYRVVGSSFNSVAATCHLESELSSPATARVMHIGVRLSFKPHAELLLS